MRTRTPRLPPLQDGELNEAQEKVIAPFRASNAAFNVSRVMVRHPRALAAFRVWATYVMLEPNALKEREREVVAMRTAWRIKSGYVWSRHVAYGRKGGLTDAEMEALKKPLSAHAWSAADAALIKATDALVDDFFVPDDVWAELTAHFSDEQCMDAIYCVGHFILLGSFLNTAGVQIDGDVPLDPDLDFSAKQ